MSEWQPIETCPENEDVIFWRYDLPRPVFCGVLIQGHCYTIPGMFNTYPDFWMPLPQPPITK